MEERERERERQTDKERYICQRLRQKQTGDNSINPPQPKAVVKEIMRERGRGTNAKMQMLSRQMPNVTESDGG